MITPEAFLRRLGLVLRRHRRRAGRTLAEVAAAAGFSLGYLSQVERGMTSISLGLLLKLTQTLDLSLVDLFHLVDTLEEVA